MKEMKLDLPALQVLGYDEVRKSRSIKECSSKMEYPMLPLDEVIV